MADRYDKALTKFRTNGGSTEGMSDNEVHDLKKVLKEESQRGSDARAVRDGNLK